MRYTHPTVTHQSTIFRSADMINSTQSGYSIMIPFSHALYWIAESKEIWSDSLPFPDYSTGAKSGLTAAGYRTWQAE